MGTVPAPASASEAMEMVHAGLGWLAAADAAALAAETQARCLRMLEQASSMTTAARAVVLAAFTSGRGYCADADYSPRAWLMHKTGVTRGAAAGHAVWARRAAAHPQVVAALAAKEMSESFGRTICQWTDKLPADCQPAADAILVTAARAGMDLRDLAALAAELYERSRPDAPDEDPGLGFEDRAVRLETTFGGAGVLGGDLTPACAAVVGAVLDALSAPAGAQDTRTRAQRYHDGLQEAMRRLLAAGLLPERAGQPVKALVHTSLADLIQLDGSSALMQEWAAQVRARWAAHRAAASVSGSDGGAWLDGDAARGAGCDASLTPVVTGEVDPAALEDIVRLSVQLDKLRRHHNHHHHHHDRTGDGDRDGDRTGDGERTGDDGDCTGDGGTSGDGAGAAEGTGGGAAEGTGGGAAEGTGGGAAEGTGGGAAEGTGGGAAAPASAAGAPDPGAARAREALEQAIIGKAVGLVSGPGGLASFLRRRQLGARLGGPSLPLDVGVSSDIPAAIRRAVILRDQHCRFPGGCDQPAAGCEVHHLTHKADGGKTSVKDCALFCFFHHQIVIHQWGWTVVLNPDGTTTAWNKDKTKVLHSHGPPARPG